MIACGIETGGGLGEHAVDLEVAGRVVVDRDGPREAVEAKQRLRTGLDGERALDAWDADTGIANVRREVTLRAVRRRLLEEKLDGKTALELTDVALGIQ